MTDLDLTGAALPEIERDRYGRPLLIAPDGTRKAYARTTTFIDVLEDRSALERWKVRTALLGVARRPTIANVFRVEDHRLEPGTKAWRDRLNALGDEALEAGGANDRSSRGTHLHTLSEFLDRGDPLPPGVDAEALADLDAYVAVRERLDLRSREIETFVVNDEYGAAGTLDRVYFLSGEHTHPATGEVITFDREPLVGDLKTGQVHAGKVAMQMHVYATASRYNPETGARTPLGARTDLGLLVHLPQGEAVCSVYLVDLELGGKGVSLAQEVRAWRNTGRKAINLRAAL